MTSINGRSTLPHYVIHGAGAVGGSMGALLARAGFRVTLVARPAVVKAIEAQGGLSLVSSGVAALIPLRAVTEINEVRPDDRTRLFLTMKAGDLRSALPGAQAVLGADVPTVTWQNGIRAESEAHPWFSNLLGGIVRATSTLLTPGEVRIRVPGILILGRWPLQRADGDPLLDELVGDLVRAGFDAVASPDIVADKGLKLLVNLFSGVSPLVRADGSATPAAQRLERNVVIEGARVLKSAGIAFNPASGRGDDVTSMLASLAARSGRQRTVDGVHNSTWQNLHHAGRRLENDYMNGEIVRLAARSGQHAPWNQRVLDLLAEVHDRAIGPNALTDDELALRLADLADPAPWHADEDDRPGR